MDGSRRGGDLCFAEPLPRDVLAKVVGKTCNLDLLIEDIHDELRGRPYELVAVAGGWRHQTRKGFAEAIRAATGLAAQVKELSRAEAGVLMAIAYFQPVTRGEISEMFGREISRDLIGSLRAAGLIAARPAQPATRRALRLCHHVGVSVAVRLREPCATCRISRNSRMPGCSRRGVPRVSARLRAGATVTPRSFLIWGAPKAWASTRTNWRRMRPSGADQNLAKVGVEGSNPFARSKFPYEK